MQMRHGLATVSTVIEDETIAGLFESQLVSDLSGFEQQMAECLMIGCRRFSDARDGFLGDDENVRGRFGCDVFERDHEIVFINDLSRNFARDDFFKQGLAHG